MAVYKAPRPNGTAIIVFPGGGYGALALVHEGRQWAYWYNAMGITAFVVKYRLGPRYHHPIELGDAQRAIRTVRARAAEFGVSPDRIGIMGFSAGGHLVSTAATHFDAGLADAMDAIDRASSRPDFLILGYPVISFDPAITHAGSVRNLLGEQSRPEADREPVERPAGHRAHAADVPLPHGERRGGAGREQRPFLPRAAEGRRAGRAARLRERPARRRHGALGPDAREMDRASGRLAARARTDDTGDDEVGRSR